MGDAAKRDGILWALTVGTGDVDKRKPGKVALRKDLYTLNKEAASINLVIEASSLGAAVQASEPPFVLRE